MMHHERCSFEPPCSTRVRMRERHGLPADVSREIWKVYFAGTYTRADASSKIRDYAEDYLRAQPDAPVDLADLDCVTMTRASYDELIGAARVVLSTYDDNSSVMDRLRRALP